MVFPGGELGVQSVGQFSGVYKVQSVVTRISNNQLTQTLQLIRRRNQEDYQDQLPATSGDALGEDQTAGSLNSPNEVERPGVTGTPQTPSTRPSTGVGRPDGVGDTSDLTNVTAKGPPGEDGEPIILTAQVAKVMAPNFQAFIDELQEEYGYVIESMGGYRDPAVAGIKQGDGTYSRTVFSWHNSGLAIDINPAYNPFKKPRPADAPDPRRLRHRLHGLRLRGLPARVHRGQEARLRRPRALLRRPELRPRARRGAHLRGVRRQEARDDR